MAVKTITIDLEAYDALSRRKAAGQSFSQVIKEHFGKAKTGRDLRDVIRRLDVRGDTVDAIAGQVARRRRDMARAPRL